MKIKKLLCLMLGLLMLLLSSCTKAPADVSSSGSSPAAPESPKRSSINLLYCYSDTFNPYTATTAINRNLCKLLYEPLIKLDNSFEPIYCLAQSVENRGNECVVKLKSTVFSDGSALTASDVVYSYNLAKASATSYASQLYEVSAVKASDNSTIVFSLSRHDPYFINLLDFPVLKSGSDKITDSDGVIQPPIGSGRYKPAVDKKSLLQNPHYYGQKGQITEITLTDAPDKDSVSHYVEVGTSDLYYTDLSDGSIVRMSGQKTNINLNHLVFIGINNSYEPLKSKELRYAISSAIDRSAVTKSAFYNNAIPATGFMSPVFEAVKPVQTLNITSNIEIALENLERIGYNNKSTSGFAVNSSGSHISLTLLVNKENHSRVLAARLIAEQLRAAGIEIKILERSYAEYSAALSSGNFQLYLGEVKILNNMDMSGLVLPGGSAAYGVAEEKKPEDADKTEKPAEEPPEDAEKPSFSSLSCKDIIDGFYSGNKSIGDVASALITEMPQIPICYRLGLLFFSSDIEGEVSASAADIYLSIERYTLKN